MSSTAPNSKSWRLSSGWAAKARQVIRENRRGALFRMLALVSEKYLRAFYNEGFYDFSRNGEAFALRVFAGWASNKPLVLWDVGANTGGWASEATLCFPDAAIHSFEIVPSIAEEFEKSQADNPKVVLHQFGLSDEPATVDVSYNVECDTTSSITYRNTDEFGSAIRTVPCRVETIDGIVGSIAPSPDLLKIDTEGHDFAVLRGARDLLAGPDAPAMIQFEYGETWLPANETLEKCHQFLSERGYFVGRLYPNHVDFKDYGYADDHFRMGNMIAVKSAELRDLLAGN